MPLTLRSEKGLALTYQELDANFQGLANGAFLETTIAGTYEFDQVNATIGMDAPTITCDSLTTGDLQYTTRKYLPGEVVQQHYYRTDTLGSFTANLGWSSNPSDVGFGRAVHVTSFDTTITPVFQDSLIVWELQIQGEPNNHDSGWLIGEEDETGVQVIRRAGYEGYNSTRPIDQQNTFMSDFYDADSSTTLRCSRILYFDKPNVAGTPKTYALIFTSTNNDNNFIWNTNRTASAPPANVREVGVSTWSIKEIKQ